MDDPREEWNVVEIKFQFTRKWHMLHMLENIKIKIENMPDDEDYASFGFAREDTLFGFYELNIKQRP